VTLSKFERRPVTRAAVKITRAGDGLSEAMRLEPEALNYDDEVFFVLRGVVEKITHEPNDSRKDRGNMVRVHVIRTTEVARVQGDDVKELLAREADRVARLREAEAGVQRLIDDPLDALSDPPPAE
jgi:hypothetical protein